MQPPKTDKPQQDNARSEGRVQKLRDRHPVLSGRLKVRRIAHRVLETLDGEHHQQPATNRDKDQPPDAMNDGFGGMYRHKDR
jgi:hypothetical protein